MGILFIITAFIMGMAAGLKLAEFISNKKIQKQNDDILKDRQEQYSEILTKLSTGKTRFKTRVNQTVYISVKLKDHGKVNLLYLMDKKDIAIFKEDKCLYTSDQVDQNLLTDIITSIENRHGWKIEDVVNVLGFVFYREDFEKSFGMKFDDISKSLGMRQQQSDSEIDNIVNNNETKFDIDEVLDKIGKLGIEMLSEEEREFLDNYSKK
jgi:uncharacterized protein YneF (UPF0154 family)